MEVEEAGVALSAGARQHRPRMRLIEPLVGREAHIAVDPEDAAPGVADQRQPGLFQRRPDRDDQVPQRRQHFCLVDRLLRPEPVRVVVVAQFPEKPERRRPEPGKRNTAGGHRLLPVIGPQSRGLLRGASIAGCCRRFTLPSGFGVSDRAGSAFRRCRRPEQRSTAHRRGSSTTPGRDPSQACATGCRTRDRRKRNRANP